MIWAVTGLVIGSLNCVAAGFYIVNNSGSGWAFANVASAILNFSIAISYIPK